MNNKPLFYIIVTLLLLIILLIVSTVSICVGSADISISNIFNIIFFEHESWQFTVIADIRFPRVILGVAVGGSLGLAGALLQGIFRNPLVEPYTLGISGGASLGVVLAIVLGLHGMIGIAAFPVTGFAGAFIVMFLVYFVSIRRDGLKVNNILLTGVMVSFIAASAVMLIMSLASSKDLQSIVFWTMGSLAQSNTKLIYLILIIALLGLFVSFFFSVGLNGFAVGEEEAAHLGINTERTKKWVFLLASLLTGLSVSVAGIIGFVGLVVPHIMRLILGHDHRVLLVSSFLAGATFLVVCDTVARTLISPLELPVGVITGIIGGTIFIYALNRKKVNF